MAEAKVKKTIKKVVKEETKEKKVAVKTVKADVVEAKIAAPKKSISLDVYGVDGKVSGKVTVPAEMFADKVNKTLLAQAVRVYLANNRQGTVSTKTRGEVDGSTRKIYRQKGTGRARHGSLRAPIFVKGGIVFGPKPRDFSLSLPTKMKRKALFSALSAKVADKNIFVVDGFDTLEAKTKQFAAVLEKLGISGKKNNVLLVTDAKADKVRRSARNLAGVALAGANRLNVYEVLKSKNLVLMKESLTEMEKTFLGK
ncbi:MAG TPA: 50S ribosomal protein L4 [Patescibacteria group bacterium]